MQHSKLYFTNHMIFMLPLNSSYEVRTNGWRPGQQKANMDNSISRLISRNFLVRNKPATFCSCVQLFQTSVLESCSPCPSLKSQMSCMSSSPSISSVLLESLLPYLSTLLSRNRAPRSPRLAMRLESLIGEWEL